MKQYSTLVALMVLAMLVNLSNALSDTTANLDKGVILKGYDPVSYFKGKPLKGNSSIKTEVAGINYNFANAANKDEFLKNPSKYTPAYEGWCATAVAGGYKYDIDPENFVITNDRLFLFYKGWKGDAKKDWVKNQPHNIELADKNWPKVKISKD